MSRTIRFAAAMLLAGTGTLALPGLAGASKNEPTEQTTVHDQARFEERVDRLCARVPLVTDRAERALHRINGDASVRGSILWLHDKADWAREAGRADLADLIDRRIDIRIERVDVLEARLDWLSEAARLCDER
jgi:hypothetical protein